jgi:hypothetical protein
MSANTKVIYFCCVQQDFRSVSQRELMEDDSKTSLIDFVADLSGCKRKKVKS